MSISKTKIQDTFVLFDVAEKPVQIDNDDDYYHDKNDNDKNDDYREHLHLEFRTRHHSGLLFFTGL